MAALGTLNGFEATQTNGWWMLPQIECWVQCRKKAWGHKVWICRLPFRTTLTTFRKRQVSATRPYENLYARRSARAPAHLLQGAQVILEVKAYAHHLLGNAAEQPRAKSPSGFFKFIALVLTRPGFWPREPAKSGKMQTPDVINSNLTGLLSFKTD